MIRLGRERTSPNPARSASCAGGGKQSRRARAPRRSSARMDAVGRRNHLPGGRSRRKHPAGPATRWSSCGPRDSGHIRSWISRTHSRRLSDPSLQPGGDSPVLRRHHRVQHLERGRHRCEHPHPLVGTGATELSLWARCGDCRDPAACHGLADPAALSEPTPNPHEARAALAEATSRAMSVHLADRQFQWMALCLAACWLAFGVVVRLVPDRKSPLVLVAVLVAATVGPGALVWLGLRIRAYSRARMLLFFGGFVVFQVWLGIVAGVSIGTRYWASTEPSYHFGVTIAIGVIPLLVLAWLLGRR